MDIEPTSVKYEIYVKYADHGPWTFLCESKDFTSALAVYDAIMFSPDPTVCDISVREVKLLDMPGIRNMSEVKADREFFNTLKRKAEFVIDIVDRIKNHRERIAFLLTIVSHPRVHELGQSIINACDEIIGIFLAGRGGGSGPMSLPDIIEHIKEDVIDFNESGTSMIESATLIEDESKPVSVQIEELVQKSEELLGEIAKLKEE